MPFITDQEKNPAIDFNNEWCQHNREQSIEGAIKHQGDQSITELLYLTGCFTLPESVTTADLRAVWETARHKDLTLMSCWSTLERRLACKTVVEKCLVLLIYNTINSSFAVKVVGSKDAQTDETHPHCLTGKKCLNALKYNCIKIHISTFVARKTTEPWSLKLWARA